MFGDLGESHYRTWSEEQKHEEIGKLVQGYRNGLPVSIMCRMAVAIAGGEQPAKQHLATLMSLPERESAVAREGGGEADLVRSCLL